MNNITRYAALHTRIQRLAASARHPSRARALDPAIREELQEIAHVAALAINNGDRAALKELHRQAEALIRGTVLE